MNDCFLLAGKRKAHAGGFYDQVAPAAAESQLDSGLSRTRTEALRIEPQAILSQLSGLLTSTSLFYPVSAF